MNTLISIAILAAAAPAPIDLADTETVEVFRCDFDDPPDKNDLEGAVDKNYDGWPDNWQRRRERGYPSYLKMKIVRRKLSNESGNNKCFRIEMNGGAATVFSPPIDVSPQFSYVMDGFLRMEEIKHDEAYCSVTFFDSQDNRLDTFYSRRFRSAKQWSNLQIGPLASSDARIRKAVIGLHVIPTTNADLSGAVMFDDIRLVRFPRMQLTTKSRHNCYYKDEPVELTCQISGISEPNPTLRFELFDVLGNQVASHVQQLDGQPVKVGKADESQEKGYVGSAYWKPPIDEFGFYRLRVTMKGTADLKLQRQTTLVVVRQRLVERGGEFGWSLSEGGQPLEQLALADLLSRVGVSWLKYPFKFSEKDHQWANRTAEFIDRLTLENIEVVGILQAPPADQQERNDGDGLIVAAMFAQQGVWQPIIDPIMSRLSLKVRWWQLGSDQDTSFVGYPELAKRITEIKNHLELFGLKVKLGFPWQWLQKSPELKKSPWEFLSYTVDPPFTQKELETYLDGNRAESGRTWVSLRPLSRTKYDLQARVLDLVQRILATKAKNTDAVFLTEPFSAERGVMQPNGTPGELFLPWRTATTLLSGTKFEGSIVLPEGSRNYVFSRGDESVMVIWHDQPKREVAFLGYDTKVVDVWGRESKLQQEGHRQVIHVDRFPKFITGVNTAVAKLRMSFQFDRTELASVFGRPQTAAFQLKNAFSQSVNGTMTLNTPPNWDAKSQFPIKLSGGREHREFFPITLRSLASTGKQQLRVDFEITADREYQFSAYREMQVGLGDVVIELGTKMNEQGDLIVKQTLINNTKQFVSFDCSLYMHSRRRKRAYVLNVGEGRHTRIYFYPNGAELVGKPVRLRAREISGQRILNYQALVEQ